MVGILAYNKTLNKYGILVHDLWSIKGLNHGDGIYVYLDGDWRKDHIQYDDQKGEWYLVHSKLRGHKLENIKVRY